MRARHLIAPLILAVSAAVLPTALPASAQTTPPPAIAAIPTDQLHPDGGVSPHVVNGERTTVRENPSLITGLRVGGGGPQGASCTASVVGRNKILTAAHCMIDVTGDKSYLYGDDDLNTAGDESFRTKVASYKVHPKYTGPNSWQNGYDVAVVTTVDDIPVPASQWAKVAGSADSALTQPGRSGVAAGWGKISSGGSSGVLNKTTMPVNDAADCQVFDVRVNPELMVCVGYNDGRTGTCSGDSGGPFTVDGVVVGVVSWGSSKCDRYSIMARLTNVMGDWAKGEIGGGQPGDGKFSVGLSPSSGRVAPGKYVSTTLTSQAGDTGPEQIELSATGLPAGTTATFQPTTIGTGGTAKVTFETSAQTPKGAHTITVQGKGSSGAKTATYTLTVDDGTTTEGPRPVLSPDSATTTPGGFVRTQITVTGGQGTSRLTATGLPTAPSFFPQSVPAGGTSRMGAFAPWQAGVYKITVTATDQAGKSGSAVYTLTVR
ncbi:trypsin-like serine protease [Embleya hyalina]|uniref:Serine protease n=1 Tax=Embleya hyalina TaxID=516124 RepID=A0A401YR37_9ACTN|nr:trypsin-like serine protease [Embleya hyalina]GCD97047.1 serine protease [Embleya hyalina]